MLWWQVEDVIGTDVVSRRLHPDDRVETEQQRAILRAQGWEYGQGYLFGRPGPDPA